MILTRTEDKEAKLARKKQRRQELANQAADKELAEISLEQQVLRELGGKQFKKTLGKTDNNKSTSLMMTHNCPAAGRVTPAGQHGQPVGSEVIPLHGGQPPVRSDSRQWKSQQSPLVSNITEVVGYIEVGISLRGVNI